MNPKKKSPSKGKSPDAGLSYLDLLSAGSASADRDAVFCQTIKEAKAGNVESMYNAAIMYQKGDGVEMNLQNSAHWFLEAAKKGHPKAQLAIAICMDEGQGVSVDKFSAVHWYNQAASKGLRDAQYRLACHYDDGDGVLIDKSEAIRWYTEASKQGDCRASYNLGQLYAQGLGVTQDYDQAFKWFRKALDQGHQGAQAQMDLCLKHTQENKSDADEAPKSLDDVAEACDHIVNYHLAQACENLQATDQDRLIESLMRATEHGIPTAQYKLAQMYEKGNGVPQDMLKAISLYEQAATQNHPEACYALGKIYGNDQDGHDPNYPEAFKWFLKGAKLGHIHCQYEVSLLYHQGNGVKQDAKTAAVWCVKAATHGDPQAQYYIGNVFWAVKGVKKNYDSAFTWFRKAAMRDFADAQNDLGICYYYGKGVKKDLKKAYEWLLKAAQHGLPTSQYNVGGCYEDGCGVARSLDEARNWYQKAFDQNHDKAGEALKRLDPNTPVEELYELGVLYKKGKDDIKIDEEKSFRFFRQAAERGHWESRYAIADAYKKGFSLRMNHDEEKALLETAISWFRPLAEQGDKRATEALNRLGVLIIHK